ncbi:MAG: flavodoxin [Clostridia bacterium]|nr:flavodoxin [Lachnospiraceae bacterium]NCC00055.1 flavodoxin [Clostridia bacterium]NCD01899.1 flavodoxin [Clostridia bacterium]
MSEIIVAYWSGTGNTEAMAGYVGQGIKEAGKEAKVVAVGDITPDMLKDCPAFALGCPSMGAEQLEETEMEPFVEAVKAFAGGKTIGLFGSYGWGDGEWMRLWVEDMENAGAKVIGGEETICNEAPNEAAQEACIDLGKDLARV